MYICGMYVWDMWDVYMSEIITFIQALVLLYNATSAATYILVG